QLLLQAGLRSLVLTLFPQTFPSVRARISDYVMQVDQAAQLKVGRFRMNGTIGYSPPSNGFPGTAIYGGATSASLTDPADWGAIVARQYWLGFDLGKDEEFLLRVGRLNV